MKQWKQLLVNGYIRFCRMVYGVDRNKVLFISFGGKSYSDNPRAVSEALHNVAPHAKITWLFADPEGKKGVVPEYIQRIGNRDILQQYKQIATAAVFVTNAGLPLFAKSKKQLLIQTWHGDKAFKKVLYDSPYVAAEEHIAESREGFCDYCVAGSAYGLRQYRSAFRYSGEVLMEGTPRNDCLVRPDIQRIVRIKAALALPEDTKLMLYAPTLRRAATGKEQQVQGLNLSELLRTLEERDGCKWRCLLRAHPAVKGLIGAGDDAWILDVSSYEDMADLLLVSDLLITDYSSCAGDFALLGRPVVLYQADRQEYLQKDRSFYFNMEDSPYFIAEDPQQLQKILLEMNEQKAKENCQKILKFYEDVETGNAAEHVAGIIKQWIER